MNLNKYTEKAREAVSAAVEQATQQNNPQLEPEHLLVALVAQPDGIVPELLRKMDLAPRDLLRTREEIYKTLKLGERELPDDEIIDLMVKHPDLIQRPIVEKGAKAILARPAERLKEIL